MLVVLRGKNQICDMDSVLYVPSFSQLINNHVGKLSYQLQLGTSYQNKDTLPEISI